MTQVKIKRIYEEPEADDGYRILVDRLWPRGMTKEKAAIDEWDKNMAPSTELRKWFGHQDDRFEEFTRLYKEELNNKPEELKRIKAIAHTQNLTLLYAARDTQKNEAVVLLEVLKNF